MNDDRYFDPDAIEKVPAKKIEIRLHYPPWWKRLWWWLRTWVDDMKKDYLEDDADVMTIREFIDACKANYLTNEDGVGYFREPGSTKNGPIADPAVVWRNVPEDFPEYSHVAWYNK